MRTSNLDAERRALLYGTGLTNIALETDLFLGCNCQIGQSHHFIKRDPS